MTASASVGALSQNVARNQSRFTTFLVQGKFREGTRAHRGRIAMFKDRRHSSGEDALTTRNVGSRRTCNTVLARDLADSGQRPNGTGSKAGNGSLCLDD